VFPPFLDVVGTILVYTLPLLLSLFFVSEWILDEEITSCTLSFYISYPQLRFFSFGLSSLLRIKVFRGARLAIQICAFCDPLFLVRPGAFSGGSLRLRAS